MVHYTRMRKQVLLVLTLALGVPCLGAPLICGPMVHDRPNQVCIATRDVSLVVSRLTANVPGGSGEFVSTDAFLPADLVSQITANTVLDPRVRVPGVFTPFLSGLDNINWVIGGLDNPRSPLAAQVSALDVANGAGTVTRGTPVLLQGPFVFTLGQFTVLDTDICPGEVVEILYVYQARVSIFTTDVSWTGAAPAVIPEPGSLVLLGCGLAGIAAARFRRPGHGT